MVSRKQHKMNMQQAREAQLHELIENIKVQFKDLSLLNRAFTHSSYANENRLPLRHHNERLEFLGDAVLDLIIGEYLFKKYPKMTEGELTKLKACTVCEGSLAACSGQLRLGDYLLLGKGEVRSGGRNRPSILADTFEALIGAIYLDQSFEAAKQFALSHLIGAIQLALNGKLGRDYKTMLQELVQHDGSESPIEYRLVGESGPDHRKEFEMEVYIGHIARGRGKGHNKKEAEQRAAEQAYKELEPLYHHD